MGWNHQLVLQKSWNHHCLDATFPLHNRPCFLCVFHKGTHAQTALTFLHAELRGSAIVEVGGWVRWNGRKSWGLTSLKLRNRARNTRVGKWTSLLRRPSFRWNGRFGECKQKLKCFFWCAEDVRWFFDWLYVDVKDEWDAHRTIGCYFEVYWSLLNICRCFACVPVKNH